MFKGKIVSRTNVNGKVHTFHKDFDDYESYQEFISSHPEYNQNILDTWNPWRMWDHLVGTELVRNSLPAETKYLPEGVDLAKYEERRREKREQARENAHKRHSLEESKAYLCDYVAENPDDTDAKSDLEKIEKELKLLA